MTYSILFTASALKEWRKLTPHLQKQFKQKLGERLIQPHVPSARLRDMKGCYKIKLRDAGYRLVYRVIDEQLIVEVIAIGKRDKNTIYIKARERL